MAWDEYRQGIAGTCVGHSPDGKGTAYRARHLAVAFCAAIGDGFQGFPDHFLKLCSKHFQRDVELLAVAIEVFVELAASPVDNVPL